MGKKGRAGCPYSGEGVKLPGRSVTWLGMACYGAIVAGLVGAVVAGLMGWLIGLAGGFLVTLMIGGLMCSIPDEEDR